MVPNFVFRTFNQSIIRKLLNRWSDSSELGIDGKRKGYPFRHSVHIRSPIVQISLYNSSILSIVSGFPEFTELIVRFCKIENSQSVKRIVTSKVALERCVNLLLPYINLYLEKSYWFSGKITFCEIRVPVLQNWYRNL